MKISRLTQFFMGLHSFLFLKLKLYSLETFWYLNCFGKVILVQHVP